MKIEDLWIGEWVKIIDSGIKGKYEGVTHDGKLKINIEENIIITYLDNIEISEPPVQKEIFIKEPESHNHRALDYNFGNTIDLHIDILAPNLKFSIPSRILSYQKEACSNFIKKAIDHQAKVIHIIHGKGEGILKNEVLHILEGFKEVKFCIPSKSGGAVEVWMNN